MVIVDTIQQRDALNGLEFAQRLPDGRWACYFAGELPPPPPPEPPAPVTSLSTADFLQRFTQSERIAIRTAAKSDVAIEDMIRLAEAAGTVRLDNPTTLAGLQYLVAQELLAAGRAAEILAI